MHTSKINGPNKPPKKIEIFFCKIHPWAVLTCGDCLRLTGVSTAEQVKFYYQSLIFKFALIQLSIMAVDPRLECLPEHEGPALRTWNIIMQTTMGKVMKPSGFCFDTSKSGTYFDNRGSFKAGEDFISLSYDNSCQKNVNSEQISKKSVPSDSSEDEDDNNNTNYAPWKRCEKYPENANGYVKII